VRRRILRRLLVAYAVKTALLAAAWLAVPDLPERASALALRSWQRLLAAAGR
jgi:hypothetical protein